MPSPRREPSLAQLIRRSPALDVASRRQWLAVLPHLTPDDRERLREILLEGVPRPPAPGPGVEPSPPGTGAASSPAGPGVDLSAPDSARPPHPPAPSPVRGRGGEGAG